MFLQGDSVILIIRLRPEMEGNGAYHNATGPENISRMTLGSATIGQLDGWRGETHPSRHDSTLHPDPSNRMVFNSQTFTMSARDKGWKTPPEKTMTITLEGTSQCIGEPIPIEGPDHVLGEMEPIARQRRDALGVIREG